MSDIQVCRRLLQQTRMCVANVVEARSQANPLVDEDGVVNHMISLLRIIDTLLIHTSRTSEQ